MNKQEGGSTAQVETYTENMSYGSDRHKTQRGTGTAILPP